MTATATLARGDAHPGAYSDRAPGPGWVSTLWALLEATQDPEVKAELMANTEAAAARSAFGIPTLFVGEEMFFGRERLGQVEKELAS